uniref:glucuronosyltransferase n=1 Tax=Romanomermis culicivorax TaxID=13658 RepID=A0A915IMY8_ROMCU
MSRFIEMLHEGCETMINDQPLLNELRRRKFDIAVAHMATFSSGLMIDYLAWELGAPSPPSFVPQLMTAYTDRMTFWQRCRNFGATVMLAYFYRRKMVEPGNKIFRRRFGQDFPDVSRLAAKSSLLLVNSEELLDYPRPILHKILYIGGIGLSVPQQLDEYWLNIVEDRAYQGVVVFSLGSIANTTLMPYAWKKTFVETFAQFPNYKVVWKFDGDLSMFEVPKNVIISKWLPQVDLFGTQYLEVATEVCLTSIRK